MNTDPRFSDMELVLIRELLIADTRRRGYPSGDLAQRIQRALDARARVAT